MEEKRADNYVNTDRSELKKIDNQISIEKNKMKRIDNLEESFVSLNNNINKCIDLLFASIKGGNVDKKLDAIRADSSKSYRRSISDLDNERTIINNNLKNLSNERESLAEKMRKDGDKKIEEEKNNQEG